MSTLKLNMYANVAFAVKDLNKCLLLLYAIFFLKWQCCNLTIMYISMDVVLPLKTRHHAAI